MREFRSGCYVEGAGYIYSRAVPANLREIALRDAALRFGMLWYAAVRCGTLIRMRGVMRGTRGKIDPEARART